ncbi:hypothetical protein T03_4375 [Trichinella britovi]|uniref:Uncharacterized protein n=1 Tax=Trichinella britovi TaxID=45882 RepID=A0A0V1C5Z2_TRIBR|nr:hypothetical protein T03_4375 [Trichinella britovi]
MCMRLQAYDLRLRDDSHLRGSARHLVRKLRLRRIRMAIWSVEGVTAVDVHEVASIRFTLARRFTFAWQRTPSGAEATSSADQNGHLCQSSGDRYSPRGTVSVAMLLCYCLAGSDRLHPMIDIRSAVTPFN